MIKNNIPEEQQITLSEFNEFMFSAIVPIKDIKDHKGEPISVLLPYWRRNKLLPFFQKGKWGIEICFAQFMWLRVLDTLREFGVTIKPMVQICKYFFQDAYDNELPKKNILDLKKTLENNISKKTTEDEALLLAEYDRMLSDELLLYGLKFYINYFTNLITDCIKKEEDAGFIAFSDGEVVEYLGEKYFSHRTKDFDLTKPHIRLSIKFFLNEFIQSDELQKIFVPTILNANEKEVLKALRKKNTSITIKKREGEIVRIVSTDEGTISDERAKEIRKILGLRNYEEITFSTRDDKTLTFTKTQKK